MEKLILLILGLLVAILGVIMIFDARLVIQNKKIKGTKFPLWWNRNFKNQFHHHHQFLDR